MLELYDLLLAQQRVDGRSRRRAVYLQLQRSLEVLSQQLQQLCVIGDAACYSRRALLLIRSVVEQRLEEWRTAAGAPVVDAKLR